MQDGDDAIYIAKPVDAKLVPDDRILIQGKTLNTFNPIVNANGIQFLSRRLRHPIPANFDQMVRAETNCKLSPFAALPAFSCPLWKPDAIVRPSV